MKLIWQWAPAVLWAMVIWHLSTGGFSSVQTAGFLLPLLRKLLPFASADTIEAIHHLIRKSAHVFEYFVFSLLLLRAVGVMRNGWKLKAALLALAIVAVYSGIDEFHQSFVPDRGPSVWDSLLDTTAATLAQVTVWWWMTRRRRAAGGGSGGNTTPRLP
jgi:VanZ family protein